MSGPSRRSLCVGLSMIALQPLSSCDTDPLVQQLRSLLVDARAQLGKVMEELALMLDRQRAALAQDIAALADVVGSELQTLAARLDETAAQALAFVQNLESKIVGDLVSLLGRVRDLAAELLTAAQSAVDTEIRRVAQEFDRQRTILVQQVRAATEAILRPTLAQLTLTGDKWIGQLNNTVNTNVVRAVGGLALAIGGGGLVAATVKRSVAGGVGGGVVAAVGLALVIAAAPIGRIGQPMIEIPDSDALCAEMRGLAEQLKAFERPPSAPARRTAVRGARIRALTPATFAAAVSAAPEPTDDRRALAEAVLVAANRCLTYATTGPLVGEAERAITRASAMLDETVFCQSAADCGVLGKACDAAVGVCLDWGYYCEDHGDCGADRPACDTSRRRCVPADGACSLPEDCAPGWACDRRIGKCASIQAITDRAEPCEVPESAPNSPCRAGRWEVTAAREVKCLGTGSAGNEVCNGIDDDCDFSVDELVRPNGCEHGTGRCRDQGQWTCGAAGWTCELATAMDQESCNGVDDDCNGQVDDVPPVPCVAPGAFGPCASGVKSCGECMPSAPSAEVCDGIDNNCDNIADPAPVCPEVVVWEQNDEQNGREMTAAPRLPTDLIDEVRVHGPESCGSDPNGRPYRRTAAEVSAWPDHGATCTFLGWENDDPTSCRIRVQYKTVQWGSTVWCKGEWRARAEGGY